MKATNFLFLLLFVPVALFAQAKPSDEATRLRQLLTTAPSDSFMTVFLRFISKNGLAEKLVAMETDLYKRKFLKGYDLISFRQYLLTTVRQPKDPRCVDKALLDGVLASYALFDYGNYRDRIGSLGQKGTKEYIYLEYLKEEGVQWREALRYALEGNTLRTDKKYFYLWVTLPNKTCK